MEKMEQELTRVTDETGVHSAFHQLGKEREEVVKGEPDRNGGEK